jgi:hypothetical protein
MASKHRREIKRFVHHGWNEFGLGDWRAPCSTLAHDHSRKQADLNSGRRDTRTRTAPPAAPSTETAAAPLTPSPLDKQLSRQTRSARMNLLNLKRNCVFINRVAERKTNLRAHRCAIDWREQKSREYNERKVEENGRAGKQKEKKTGHR